ncbi:MAG: response regulator [Gammaproteobacteria bacterium]|nr:response regulator [Gammaproteobacteria bacterium]
MDAKRILFIDDEPLSVSVAIDTLKSAGYTTDYIESGEQAWQVLNEQPNTYDAVIVDRVMPEVGGIELLQKIKQSPVLHDLPVIVETASEDSADYLTALEAGASDFIYKPLERDFLLYVVDNAVNDGDGSSVYA